MAEHRVRFVEALDLGSKRFSSNFQLFGKSSDLGFAVRQKFVQWRIERADCDWITIHCFEYAEKIFTLEGFYLLQCEFSLFASLGDDHLANCIDPVAFEKHMLCAAKTD